jgi:cytochrome P450
MPRDRAFSILPFLQRITFDVILETIFGASEGEELETLRVRLLALVERAQSPLGMLWLLPALQRDLGPLTGWAAIKRAIAAADESILALISRARSEPRGQEDVLSLLLAARDDEGQGMSDQELRDELMTLLLAGYETTATALAWTIDEAARRPDVLAGILAEPGAADGEPAPYLDATFKEALRLHPVAPLIARRAAAPVTLGGYEIPAGSYLVPCPYNAQRHPAFWDAPAEFRPERFLGSKIDPYAWLPFGGGSRRCIGMALAMLEARVALGVLLSEVAITLPGPRAAVKLRSFLFAPAGGPRVLVQDRPMAAVA